MNEFENAYKILRNRSELLTKSDCGLGEVYLTGEVNSENALITIVDLERREFWTKTRAEIGDKFDIVVDEFRAAD